VKRNAKGQDPSRIAEGKERDWWARRHFLGELAWKEAKWVGKGRMIGVPRDFLEDHFDYLGVRDNTVVGVQVSLSNLRASRAKHGTPLFSWVPPKMSVEAFAEKPLPGFYQILSSYGESGAEREWWVARRKGSRKPQLVQSSIEEWGERVEGRKVAPLPA
jgi:hypothetical protein